MKCQKHNREIVSNCTWCGRQMCSKCITITDGKKMYCDTCSAGPVGKQVREKQMKMIQEHGDDL